MKAVRLRTWFYLKMLRECSVDAGDVMKLTRMDPEAKTITEMVRAVEREEA